MDDSKVVGGKVKKPGKRGRKPAKIDLKAKLERSRQSARECRARKKLRYQYLEELVSSRERAICALREELEMAEVEQLVCILLSIVVGNYDVINYAAANRYSVVKKRQITITSYNLKYHLIMWIKNIFFQLLETFIFFDFISV
ncbi:hypothetical protein ASZ78_016626 [Callipepla squamata]|uniref:cAMP-responsive element-binding protein-like 2 n=1 Tax=Callipepla squamata TaxID=9009 RepID=A0A226NDF9_CALSU|nr:hypothetical protein ASZ78_016626 [Callipepla squamata]